MKTKHISPDKISGCLLGTAIGDALGMPNEDLSKKRSLDLYGGHIKDFIPPHRDSVNGHLNRGCYTDDTQLTLIIAESIIECKGLNPERLAGNFCSWYKSKDERNRGHACSQACERLLAGVPWYEAGANKAGVGGAMRVAPVGLWYAGQPEDVAEMAALSCRITHRNIVAIDGAVTIAYAISLLSTADDCGKSLINILIKSVKSSEFKAKLQDVDFALKSGLGIDEAIQLLGNSEAAAEGVPLALFIFLSSPRDYANMVLSAANATGEVGGDTDTIACMVGALSGAYNGISNIPPPWVKDVEGSKEIQKIAQAFHKARLAL